MRQMIISAAGMAGLVIMVNAGAISLPVFRQQPPPQLVRATMRSIFADLVALKTKYPLLNDLNEDALTLTPERFLKLEYYGKEHVPFFTISFETSKTLPYRLYSPHTPAFDFYIPKYDLYVVTYTIFLHEENLEKDLESIIIKYIKEKLSPDIVAGKARKMVTDTFFPEIDQKR